MGDVQQSADSRWPSQTGIGDPRQPGHKDDVVSGLKVKLSTGNLERTFACAPVDSWVRAQIAKCTVGHQSADMEQMLNLALERHLFFCPLSITHDVCTDIILKLVQTTLSHVNIFGRRVGE